MAVGHIVSLWGNVLELAEDGNITKWSIEDVSDYSNYKGDPKLFYKALLNYGDGWIDEKDGLKIVHDWWDYAGRYLKTKYRNTHPEKLDYIMSLYKRSYERPSKDRLKTVNQPTNLPTYLMTDKLLTEFYNAYQQKVKTPYVKEPHKDRAVFKMLLKDIPENQLFDLITKFFDSSDPFIQKAGYTVGVFKSVINKLRVPEKPQVRYE